MDKIIVEMKTHLPEKETKIAGDELVWTRKQTTH